MPDKVRIFVESPTLIKTQVYPVIKGEFERKRESGKRYYKHEAKDKFKFSKSEDYALLLPEFANECQEITLTIEKLCGGVYGTYWTGVFKMGSGTTHDQDKCFITIKPKTADAYKCFEDGLDTEQNVFGGSPVSTLSVGGTIETELCTMTNSQASCNDFYQAYFQPLNDCLDEPTEWCLQSNVVLLNGDADAHSCDFSTQPHFLVQQTTWHREILETDCIGGQPVPPPFSSGWQLLENNCGATNKSTWWRCPSSTGQILGPYDTGRNFKVFLQNVVDNMDCALTVKSDFFGINAAGDAPDNIAYDFAAANCHNITVHHKSDIKFPGVVGSSTSAAWTLKAKDWFEDLKKIFNVDYIIENGVLILEHVSFFTAGMGIDLSNVKMPKKLEYGGTEDVKYENFHWPESVSSAFRSQPIVYDCGTETKDPRCVLLHADIAYIQDPDNDEKVGDEGFVLISNEVFEGNLIVNSENDPFRWVNLQNHLHKHDRLYKTGKINGVQQEFLSWIPYIKQEKFSHSRCCNDATFKANELITTPLGIASVETANENIYTDKLELELAY